MRGDMFDLLFACGQQLKIRDIPQLFFKKYSNNFLLRNFLLKEIFKGQFDLWQLFNKNQPNSPQII